MKIDEFDQMKFRYNAILSVLKPLTARQAEEVQQLQEFREKRVKQECHYLEKENYELKKELKDIEKTLGNRDTILSIMYDLVRNEDIPDDMKIWIIKIVVNEACGQDLSLTETVVCELYYHGLFR